MAPAIEVPSTPLPNPEDIPTSPAWDPSSQTPRHGDDGNYILIQSQYVLTDLWQPLLRIGLEMAASL